MSICTERCCNQSLLPLVAQPDLGISCSVPPPTGHLPLGSGRCSRLVTSQHADLCVYECPTWIQRGLKSQTLGWYLSGYLHIWRPITVGAKVYPFFPKLGRCLKNVFRKSKRVRIKTLCFWLRGYMKD